MNRRNDMQRWMTIASMAIVSGCADLPQQRPNLAHDAINRELERAATERKPVAESAVSRALLPPLVVEMPRADAQKPEARFDLSVSNAPAGQVFMAIVSGTRYSMVLHPEVKGEISVNLKDVTVTEALDTLRDLYGFDYTMQGNRIVVLPAALQTRIFQVNYLQAQRRGQTETRVSSGSIASGSASPGTPAPGAIPVPTTGPTGGAGTRAAESTRVTTTSDSDFWGDIQKSLFAILGGGAGSSVVVNAQSGVIVVRAMPGELRNVEKFLKSMQLIVERQVVLEAKIIEVSLKDGYQAGVNWAAFRDGSTRFGAGVVSPGASLGRTGTISAPTARAADGTVLSNSALTGGSVGTIASGLALGAGAAGGVFGLALQTQNFAALLSFLETQGTVNVLSSPRVATINNQKAVLKVGTDDFFVTNVSTTSSTSGTNTTVTPTITVAPFFSGIALDVTPQIDGENNIILHIHPSVSNVVERRKVIDLGSLGSFTLPLASSDVNETDTIVRVQDSNIVAIGGLMRQQSINDRSQVPGVGNVPGLGNLFRQRDSSNSKSELVILLKPTIIHGDRSWQEDLAQTRDRIRAMGAPEPQR
ncbi:MAG: pilus (MSHA type) biogenesis protein MshL [Burkholderiales bacterium]|nr:pilus (MSHA type) biogenesis protein MshL [Burkholderiales bacterium]